MIENAPRAYGYGLVYVWDTEGGRHIISIANIDDWGINDDGTVVPPGEHICPECSANALKGWRP